MAPLKELGRAAGERQKSASKAAKEFTFVGPSTKTPETSASDWCHTNMQCHAVCVGVTDLFIDVSFEKMHGAPRIRKD